MRRARPDASFWVVDGGLGNWLTQAYERYGVNYVWGAVLALIVAYSGIVAILTAIVGRYERLSLDEVLLGMAAIEIAAVLAFLLTVHLVRDDISLLIAWTMAKDRESRDATAVWEVAVRLPRRVMFAGVWRTALLVTPIAVVMLTRPVGYPPFDMALVAASVLTAALVAVIFGLFVMEAVVAPLARDITGFIPMRKTQAEAGVPLAPKFFAGLVSLTLLAGFLTTMLLTDSSDPDGQRLGELALTVSAVLVLSLPLVAAIALTLLGPIGELTRGTKAVGAGQLDTTVPVSSSDELGALAASFNEMVAGLRERESLREHNTELVEELQASRARIVAAADAERKAVERDLHDGAQQHLVLLDLKLGLVERALAKDPAQAGEIVEEARGDLDNALGQLRDLAHGIYPSILTSDGLPGALNEATMRSAIQAGVDCEGAGRYHAEIEAAVYFCCLEALQNAAKHAGESASATVRVAESDGKLSFEVADTGVGFDPATTVASAGLQNMTDRIGALGGDLRVESVPGEGTKVIGQVPVGQHLPGTRAKN